MVVWFAVCFCFAPMGNSEPDLAAAQAAFGRGDYVTAHRHFSDHRQAGGTLAGGAADDAGYAAMAVAYRLYYAYLTHPTHRPSPAEWERLADLVRDAQRLSPGLDYAPEVLEAIGRQQRRAVDREEFAARQLRTKVGQRDR